MAKNISFLRSLLTGLALSLPGGALVVLALWAMPAKWMGGVPVALRMGACVALLYLPGLWRSIQLWGADRSRQAGFTLLGCTIGTLLLTLLGALFVAIAIGEALPRHD